MMNNFVINIFYEPQSIIEILAIQLAIFEVDINQPLMRTYPIQGL